jgi:hypothetical protein
MIILEYDSMDGLALPEGKICDFVDQFIVDNNDKDVHLVCSQELILDYFRLAIVQGRLDYNNILVQYQDETTTINSNGRLDRWPMPTYCCDVLSQLLEKRLT